MKELFKRSDLAPLVTSLQELLKKVTDEQEFVELQGYINQFLQFQQDVNILNKGIDEAVIVAVTNVKGDIIYVNRKFCDLSKYSLEELIGANHRILKSDYHDKEFFRHMWKTIASGNIWEGEIKNKAKDGSCYWVKTTIVPILDKGVPVMYISLRTDITQGKLAQERLVQALKNDFRLVVNSMYNLIFKVRRDPEKKFIYTLNEGKLAYHLGLDNEKMYIKSPLEIFSNELGVWLEDKYEEAFEGKAVTYTFSYHDKNLLTYLSPVYEDNEIVELIGCVSDITDLHKAQEEVKFMAYHDILTNLPNRRKFNEDLQQLISVSSQKNLPFSVFFIDLDRFKQINDALGHTVGDMLITSVAARLQNTVGDRGEIYRFAGDEFIIVYPNLGRDRIHVEAELLLESFEETFTIANSQAIYTTPSIGISIYPEHGKDYDTLLKNADTAMFVSKANGRNHYEIYEWEMNQHHEEALFIEHYLRKSVANGDFVLHYQPKLDLKTETITSMEALLRWEHPILGRVAPDKFIPIAEETGLIIKIDEWVLKAACRQNNEWLKRNPSAPLRVAVNISPLHFTLPTFVNLVATTLEETGLPPEYLEIEITESSFIEAVDVCIRNLQLLRDMGVHVAIDDFGTGYSSLNYLRKFPITSLKIDRSFIQEVSENKEEIAIIKAMIFLSHELNLKVVAEGTETKEVIQLLKELGCDEAQGYYISRPLPKDEFEKVVDEMNGKVQTLS